MQGSPHFPVETVDAPLPRAASPATAPISTKATRTNGKTNGVKTNGFHSGEPAPQPAEIKTPGKLFNLTRRTNSLLGVQIVGVGSYVPDLIVTN